MQKVKEEHHHNHHSKHHHSEHHSHRGHGGHDKHAGYNPEIFKRRFFRNCGNQCRLVTPSQTCLISGIKSLNLTQSTKHLKSQTMKNTTWTRMNL